MLPSEPMELTTAKIHGTAKKKFNDVSSDMAVLR
jgi:hypothetical protein